MLPRLFVFHVCLLAHVLIGGFLGAADNGVASIENSSVGEGASLTIRRGLIQLLQAGKHVELLEFLDDLERKHGTLRFGEEMPTLYGIRGVAYHNAMRLDEAERALVEAVRHYPDDGTSWYNLGEIRLQMLNLKSAILAFREALTRGNQDAYNGLVRAQGWTNDWRDFEVITSKVEALARSCCNYHQQQEQQHNTTPPQVCRGSVGLEYTSLPGHMHRLLTATSPYAQANAYHVAGVYKPAPCRSIESCAKGRLRVGIVSSDFGIHPVATLIRGVVQFLTERHKSRVELFAFALYPEQSYWGLNVTNTVEHFVSLHSLNTPDAADVIASHNIDVLIDLNGHTQHSGLSILAHRPAPVQMSFLGWPQTTGYSFIDFYLGDSVAMPPEQANQFSESLSLLPACYIANDYAQMQGDVAEFFSNGDLRAPRSALHVEGFDVQSAQILLATLSNSMKIDRTVFDVWMNILRRFSGAHFIFVQHKGSESSTTNHGEVATMHGIRSRRLVPMPQAAWIEHLYAKTSIDLVLDTVSKNGHTTGLDGIWAGIPSLSFSSGGSSSARAGESIAMALGMESGLAHSMKEYEDMAFRLLRDHRAKANRMRPPLTAREVGGGTSSTAKAAALEEIFQASAPLLASKRLQGLRDEVRRRRLTSGLFDTERWTAKFVRQLQATWEAAHLAYPEHEDEQTGKVHTLEHPKKKTFQVFSSPPTPFSTFHGAVVGKISTGQVYSGHTGPFSIVQYYRRRGLPVPPEVVAETAAEEAAGGGEAAAEKTEAVDYPPIPPRVFANEFVFLNIGGQQAKAGWWNVNSQPAEKVRYPGGDMFVSQVDVVRPMHDLRGFADASVSAIYSSHTLEHASFGDGMLSRVLVEWFRVLKAGGLLLISVPDLPTLARLYLDPALTPHERFLVVKMMYGAQSDQFDYHKVGFDEHTLRFFVEEAGFCNFKRVGAFNIHNDTSLLEYKGKTISLNVAAHKCYTAEEQRLVREAGATDFMVEHGADPYVPPPE